MLSPTFIEERKQQLLAKRAELQAKLAAIPVHTELGSDYEDTEMEVEIDLPNDQVIEEMKEHLSKIDAALGRIEAGEYGKDLVTGDWIDEKRLNVYPEAETAAA